MNRILPLLLVLSLATPLRAAEFELKDGDRVVWLGGTLVEREQRYGYWEFLLTAQHPERNITFRNLGWSGDTVHGEARLRFDINQPQLGLQRMVELTLAEKPTVIFIAYGANESFEGKEGLPKFEKGLEKLLDALAPAKARIVLFSPLPESGKLLTPKEALVRNQEIALYRDAIAAVAQKRKLTFGDLFYLLGEGKQPLAEGASDNGMHLTAAGYALTAETLRATLAWPSLRWEADLGEKAAATHAALMVKEPRVFELAAEALAAPLPKSGAPRVRCSTLGAGDYSLMVDGTPRASANGAGWKEGVALTAGPDHDQAILLLRTIVEKNQLYFHRWRPQNETYLFGFRKHEQGRNAKEIVEFDPLIAEKEKEIARLRKPVAHQYSFVEVKK